MRRYQSRVEGGVRGSIGRARKVKVKVQVKVVVKVGFRSKFGVI